MLKRRTASAGFFPQIWDNRKPNPNNKDTSINNTHQPLLSKSWNLLTVTANEGKYKITLVIIDAIIKELFL